MRFKIDNFLNFVVFKNIKLLWVEFTKIKIKNTNKKTFIL